MGKELACTLRYEGKTVSGKALLESAEIIFRGETRLRIPLNTITSVDANGGELHIRTKEGRFIFELGPQAERWREKIANPRSVLEKLGVKSGQSVSLFGDFPTDFVASLRKLGANITKGKMEKSSAWIFVLADEKSELARIPSLAKRIQGSTALWLVYPKGQKSITESDVRSAGLRAGLVDVKVVGFSESHTALKFVLPKSKR